MSDSVLAPANQASYDYSEIGAIRELAEKYVQWVTWREEKGKDGRVKKVPVNPITGKNGSVSNPNTWGSHQQACDHLARNNKVKGIGFVLSGLDGLVCLDLDSPKDSQGNVIKGKEIVDPDTGAIKEEWARKLVDDFHTYTEISPSGTGLHLWIRGAKPGGKCRRKNVEIYGRKRFITITGQWLELAETDEIEERQEQLSKLYADTFTSAAIAKPNGHDTRPADPITDRSDATAADPVLNFVGWSMDRLRPLTDSTCDKPIPVAAKIQAIVKSRERGKFNRVWKAERNEDQSQSDLAIANSLLGVAFKDGELSLAEFISALIFHRKEYGDGGKKEGARPDYWARTAAEALGEEWLLKGNAKERAAAPVHVDDGGDFLGALNGDLFGKATRSPLTLTGVEVRGDEWSLRFAEADKLVKIGNINKLSNPKMVRDAIFVVTGRFIPLKSRTQWDTYLSYMWEIKEEKDIGPGYDASTVAEDLLSKFIADHGAKTFYNREKDQDRFIIPQIRHFGIAITAKGEIAINTTFVRRELAGKNSLANEKDYANVMERWGYESVRLQCHRKASDLKVIERFWGRYAGYSENNIKKNDAIRIWLSPPGQYPLDEVNEFVPERILEE